MGSTRPAGGRPPGRRGRGGVGPGPAYRPGGGGGGTTHKSGAAHMSLVILSYAMFIALPLGVVAGIALYFFTYQPPTVP